MIRRYTTVATVVALAAAVANPAYAQRRRPAAGHPQPPASSSPPPAASTAPAPVDPTVVEARREYDGGRQAMEAHQFDEALRHFRRAHELRSNPVVLVPISQAQIGLNRLGDAIATLQRYLHDRADAPDRAQIEAQIADLQHRRPTLHVTSSPAGGRIFVDGVDSSQVTPADIAVDPGHHGVGVELAGRVTASQELDAAASARVEVALVLPAQPAAAGTTATVATTTTTTPTPTTGTVAVRHEGPNPAVWVAGGLAAVGIVAGSVFGIMALGDHADFQARPSAEIRDRGETNALIADISFGVGILSAAVAVVVWLSSGEETAHAHAALHTNPSHGPRLLPAANGLVLQF
ncbi:MAG: tetratricopeptide repeat protein [Deltaproteobacteria bacterium]